MASRIRWSELKLGLAAFAGLVGLALSILLFARVGALHGDTETLYVTVDHAPGVLAGTDVWLAGQKVGLVKAINFRSVASDTLERLAIETEILADRLPLIRKDAYADIRPGGNLIGSPVIYIGGGTVRAPPVKGGDTISARFEGPIGAFGVKIDTVVARVTAAADTSEKLIALMNDRRTSIGAFRTRGMASINTAREVTSGIMSKATTGSGTLGLANRNAVRERLGRVMAQKDSIKLLLSSGRGNVGRFRRDSTLMPQVAGIRAEVDSLRRLFSTPGSGISRLRSDSTLQREIGLARVQLDSLMMDLRKHPLKYISF
ncbi:MAG TPA: MlaD family protein [Rhodothermia bacterium]|nr:MlaD family protein [Rhodothermia bacterium]